MPRFDFFWNAPRQSLSTASPLDRFRRVGLHRELCPVATYRLRKPLQIPAWRPDPGDGPRRLLTVRLSQYTYILI